MLSCVVMCVITATAISGERHEAVSLWNIEKYLHAALVIFKLYTIWRSVWFQDNRKWVNVILDNWYQGVLETLVYMNYQTMCYLMCIIHNKWTPPVLSHSLFRSGLFIIRGCNGVCGANSQSSPDRLRGHCVTVLAWTALWVKPALNYHFTVV